MEIVADIVAGLGLFFIGVRSIGTHMKQMTGARFRRWVAWATGHHLSAALVGTAAGIVTQSSNAVTFISVSLVTSGIITPARALPILAWANVGTALLVFVATLDIHIAVLFLLGVVGFCYYFGLNERERGRHLLGALYGVGMLFFGVWLIKQGARPMKDLESVRAFIRVAAQSQVLPFVAGLLLTLVIQSSSTMSAIAVTMAAAGVLTLDQTLMIVLGSNVGSGLSTFLLSGNLTGTGRQLAFIQLAVKALGVLILLPLLLLAQAADARGSASVIARLGGSAAEQVAVAFLILQVVSAVSAGMFSRVLLTMAGRLFPPSLRDVLSKPHFIYEQALDEPETALDLVEQEQARVLVLLPRLLDPLRAAEVDGTPYQHQELLEACTNVAGECAGFIDRLMARAQSHSALERVMSVRARNELLVHMMEGCHDFVDWLGDDFPEPAARALRESLVEGLCTVLLVLSDAADDGAHRGEHDYAIALALTSDRASVMEGVRAGFIGAERGLGPDSQTRLLPATSVFERVIWLANRYAIALDRQGASDQQVSQAAADRPLFPVAAAPVSRVA
jgi:phosphate:Na+ symporter